MQEEQTPDHGPDLTKGVDLTRFVDGRLVGHVGDQGVLLVRGKSGIFAVAAHCTHYHGPLSEGLIVEDSIRCPWHHACFDLCSGEALRAPAISPLACWRVEQRDNQVFVLDAAEQTKVGGKTATDRPDKIVIVGGGAAGFAAAEMLRRRDYRCSIVMVSSDDASPVDRPNLSKDYLAGNAPEEWVPLRPDSYYPAAGIDLHLNSLVSDIDVKARNVVTASGEKIEYDRLLLASGAEPVRLSIPGSEQSNVYTLRSLSDCRAIINAANGARRAVVIGASFIGLEVAAALRTRGIEVHVVAPEKRPMERILGPEIGDFIRSLHEEHGVVFHLEDTVAAIENRQIILKSGAALDADFVVVGIGVRPRLKLAEQAGLTIDRGVLVNAFLETSAPGIYAAGDIARWPDPRSGQSIRVEHWVVAQRQGQTAALNMLGQREKFDAVPFFWSQHYDVPINYVGHAEQWDEIAMDGTPKTRSCLAQYKHKGQVLAVASIFRDVESLQAELKMEGPTGLAT